MLSTLAISLPELTIQATIVLALSIVSLLLISRGRTRSTPRQANSRSRGDQATVSVARIEPPLYRRPNPIRRVVSLALSGAIGILIGVICAILIAFVAAIVVSQLSSMMR